MTLEGQVMIVTGGAGAIAAAILRAFSDAGARVAVVDTSMERARAAADAVRGFALEADLSSADAAEAMVRTVAAECGRVDGLVHTVGGFAMGTVEESDPALFDQMFALNVRTLFFALRAVVPTLRRQNGGFVAAFSSEPAWIGRAPGTALYGAAKAAVANLCHSLDAELAGTDVKVAVIYPMGAVDTPANRRAMPDFDPAGYIDPVDIAEALVFSASRSPRARVIDLSIYPRR